MSNHCRSFKEPCPYARPRFGWQMSNRATMPETWSPAGNSELRISSKNYRGMPPKDSRSCGGQIVDRPDAAQNIPREQKKQQLTQEYSEPVLQEFPEYGNYSSHQSPWHFWEPCRCCGQQLPPPPQRCRGQQPSAPPQRCRGQQPPAPPQKCREQQPPAAPQKCRGLQPPLSPQRCYCQHPPPQPQRCYEQQPQPPPPKRCFCPDNPPPERCCCPDILPQGCRCPNNPPPPQPCRCPDNPPPPERCCCPDNPPPPKRCCCPDIPPPLERCCCPDNPPPPKRCCCPDIPPPPQRCCCPDNPPPPKRCCCPDIPPPPQKCCCPDNSAPPGRCCSSDNPPLPKRCCCSGNPPPPQKCCCSDNPPPERCCCPDHPPPPERCCCPDNTPPPERCCCPDHPPPPKRCCCQDKPPPHQNCCCSDHPAPPQKCCCPNDTQPPKKCCCPDMPPPPQKCCCQDTFNCRGKRLRKRKSCRRMKCYSCECMCVVTHEVSVQTEPEPPCPEPPVPDRIEIIDVTTQEREVRHRNGEVEVLVDEIQTVTVVPNDGSKPTKSQVTSRVVSSNPDDPQRVQTHFKEEIDPDSIVVPDKAMRYSVLEPIMTNLKDLPTPPSGYASPSETKDRRVYRTNEQFEKENEYNYGKKVTKTVMDDPEEFRDSKITSSVTSSPPSRRQGSKRSPKISSPSNRELLSSKQKKNSNGNYSPSKRPVFKFNTEEIVNKEDIKDLKQTANPVAFKPIRLDSGEPTKSPKKVDYSDGPVIKQFHILNQDFEEQSETEEIIRKDDIKDVKQTAKPVAFKTVSLDSGKPTKASKTVDNSKDQAKVAHSHAVLVHQFEKLNQDLEEQPEAPKVIEDPDGNLVLKPVASDFSQISTVHVKVTNRQQTLSQKAGRKSIHQDAVFETKISELRLLSPVSEEESEPEPTPTPSPEPEPEPKPKCRIRMDMKNAYPSNDIVCRRKIKCCVPNCRVPCGSGYGACCGAGCGACYGTGCRTGCGTGCRAGRRAGRKSHYQPRNEPCSSSIYPPYIPSVCTMQFVPIGFTNYCDR
ncbi:uncharacterized protein LOC110177973 isoform X1 [Drosophila serrata]|uniref:uncharacterized protein LOC110177973 isoform X1 n=2 Tax=Drosophila serrata TaxID=7274 RepID=UPI000A1D1ABB|nr:uncharacterized protein LOC110177973 isoform X1 [Drosophila serrata]